MSKSHSSLGSATLAVPKLFFVFAGIVVFSFAYYALTIERTKKKVKEIERIESKPRDCFPCVQYKKSQSEMNRLFRNSSLAKRSHRR